MLNHLRISSLIVCCTLISFFLFAQPQADFFFELPQDANKFTAPVKADFTNATAGISTEFTWLVNGEVFSNLEEPSWLFTEGGKYRVCLEAKNRKGKDKICQTLEFFDPAEKAEDSTVSIE